MVRRLTLKKRKMKTRCYEMQHDEDEDNECPWCGFEAFYEYIEVDPKTLKGVYEFNCQGCGKSGTVKFDGSKVIG